MTTNPHRAPGGTEPQHPELAPQSGVAVPHDVEVDADGGSLWREPPPPAPVPPARGIGAWLQFLWLYVPVPLIGHIAWVAGALVSFVGHRHGSRVAAENARTALNWTFTVCVVQLLLVAGAVLSMVIATVQTSPTDAPDHPMFIVYMVFLLTFILTGVIVLVVGIAGAVTASKNTVFALRMAIPFVRPRRQDRSLTP